MTTRQIKEELNIIDRNDDKIRLTYWNKAAGETQIIFSKKIGRELQKKLRNILLNR